MNIADMLSGLPEGSASRDDIAAVRIDMFAMVTRAWQEVIADAEKVRVTTENEVTRTLTAALSEIVTGIDQSGKVTGARPEEIRSRGAYFAGLIRDTGQLSLRSCRQCEHCYPGPDDEWGEE